MKPIFTFFLFAFLSSGSIAQTQVQLSLLTDNLDKPVDIANNGDDRLFVVEQEGLIRIVNTNGDVSNTPFLNIRTRVNLGRNEQGMLGLAFHPDYDNNGFFFVNYVTGNGDGSSRVSRFKVMDNDPNQADPNSEEIILQITQPDWNHNGGDLNFGPDGYLYIGFGDGGSGGDPWGNGQNPQTFLGKMLRLDVDNGLPYTIPADNPFVDDSDVRDEIWAIGLRNPWRYSFDDLTGDLWIGDVGQNAQEEIDFQAADSEGGENYGWDCREGLLNYAQSSNLCVPNLDLEEPVAAYKVSNFCNSVTGGYVYRGCKYPELFGKYLYADYCNGLIWSIEPDGQGGWTNTEVFENPQFDFSTFGVDVNNEMYVATYQSDAIYKIEFGEELASPDLQINGTNISVPSGLGTYQWYLNNNPIPGATTNELNVSEDGEYYLVITYSGGCTTTSEAVSIVLVNTNELLTLQTFAVHPSPFSTHLNINIELTEAGKMYFDIFDLQGKKIATYDAGNDGQFNDQIDLSHVPSGIYLLRLYTEEGEVVKRLVKN